MKGLRFTKRKIAVGSAVAVLATGGAVAYAYFASTGSGTGSGAVGSVTTADVHVIGTETTALLPGGAGGTVSFTAWNAGAGAEHLSNITLDGVTAIDSLGHDVTASCPADSWSMAPVSADDDLAPDGSTPGSAITETGTLYMLDNSKDQSACEGATLTLSFTTS